VRVEGGLRVSLITLEDYFGRLSFREAPSEIVRSNALGLIAKVNGLLLALAAAGIEAAKAPIVNSGWRPAWHNKTIANAAPNSKHITGEAVDVADPDGEIDEYLLAHQDLLIGHGLYIEHPSATKGWSHLQCVPPRSGNRVFFP
jgi:hypothetical protein